MGWGRVNVHVTMHNILMLRERVGWGGALLTSMRTMHHMLTLPERMGWGGVGQCQRSWEDLSQGGLHKAEFFERTDCVVLVPSPA